MFLKLLISMAVALPFDPIVQDWMSRTGCPKFRHGWNSGAPRPALAQRGPRAICSPGLSEIVRGLRIPGLQKSSAAAEPRISVALDGPDASLPNGGHSASGLSR